MPGDSPSWPDYRPLYGGEDGCYTVADTTARLGTCSSLAQVYSVGTPPPLPPRMDVSSATSPPTTPAVACDAGHSDPSGAAGGELVKGCGLVVRAAGVRESSDRKASTRKCAFAQSVPVAMPVRRLRVSLNTGGAACDILA